MSHGKSYLYVHCIWFLIKWYIFLQCVFRLPMKIPCFLSNKFRLWWSFELLWKNRLGICTHPVFFWGAWGKFAFFVLDIVRFSLVSKLAFGNPTSIFTTLFRNYFCVFHWKENIRASSLESRGQLQLFHRLLISYLTDQQPWLLASAAFDRDNSRFLLGK